MTKKELGESKLISPIVKHYFPHLSRREQIEYTAVLRPYFRAHFDAYCRMDAEGLLEGGSENNENPNEEFRQDW